MNELSIVNSDLVTINDKNYFNRQIDLLIDKYKGNRQQINKLVFESVACLTEADRKQNILNNKSQFGNLIGIFTGSNRKLQKAIEQNHANAQYLAQQILKQMAEQNLLAFDLIATVNNKLNYHVESLNGEIEKIYIGLNKFLKLYQNQMIQTEIRLNKLERNVNLLTWSNSIEYQMFDEKPYLELDYLSKIVCITKDFFEITNGNWEIQDLFLLKSLILRMGLYPDHYINLWDTIIRINESEELKDKLIGTNHSICDNVVNNNLIFIEAIYKLDKLNFDERYTLIACNDILSMHNISVNENMLINALSKSFIENNYDIRLDTDIKIFELILELLFNLKEGNQYLRKNYKVIEKAQSYLEYSSPGVELYHKGKYEEAFNIFKANYEAGDLSEIFYLASCYLYGRGINCNYRACLDLVNEALENDYDDVYFLLGKLYDEGLGCKQDKNKGIYYYENAIEKASSVYVKGMSLNNLALKYETGDNVDIDISKAIELYEEGINCGNGLCAYNLGKIHFKGLNGEINYNLAFYFYSIGGEYNEPHSLNMLGYFYEKGLSGSVSYEKAIEYYKSSYKNGLGEAAYNYSRFFETGIGVEENFEAALEVLKKAIDCNVEFAIYKLGDWYFNKYSNDQEKRIIIGDYMRSKQLFSKLSTLNGIKKVEFETSGSGTLDEPLI